MSMLPPRESLASTPRHSGLHRREIGLALFVALIVRLFLIFAVDYKFDQGDATEYDLLARNIVEHGSLSLDTAPPFTPTFRRAPLFPGELAVVYRIFGHHYGAVQAVQVVLDLATCLLMALGVAVLAPAAARITLWLVCLSPFNALYCGALLSETLCTFFLVAGVMTPLLVRHRVRWLLAGLFLGLAALTRDIYLALIPLIATVLLWAPSWRSLFAAATLRTRASAAAAVVLGAVLAIAPWTMRNDRLAHEWIPVSKGILGQAIWIGTWEVDGAWESAGVASVPPDSYRTPEEKAAVKAAVQKDGVAREKALMALALERIRTEPFYVLGRWIRRAPRTWFGTRFELFGFKPAFLARGKPAWILLKGGLFLANFALIVLALAGMVLSLRRARAVLYLAVPVVYNFFIFFPLHGTEPRYSQPVYPFVLVFSAIGLMACHAWLRLKSAPLSAVKSVGW